MTVKKKARKPLPDPVDDWPAPHTELKRARTTDRKCYRCNRAASDSPALTFVVTACGVVSDTECYEVWFWCMTHKGSFKELAELTHSDPLQEDLFSQVK